MHLLLEIRTSKDVTEKTYCKYKEAMYVTDLKAQMFPVSA